MNHHPAKRTFGRICIAAALLVAWASSTLSQSFPSGPITLVVPYAVGSNIDLMVRSVADLEFKFESGRNFRPVSLIASFPLVLVSNPAVPAKDVKGLIAYAKSNPGKLNMAGGSGSISHIAFERFSFKRGTKVTTTVNCKEALSRSMSAP